MKKFSIKSIVVIIIILVFTITNGIILLLNFAAKYHREQLWAETNKIKIGEENILYVDLTKKADDYNKINQTEKIEKTEELEEVKEPEELKNNEIIVNKISEYAYHMEFNLNENKAIIDGKESSIDDVIENYDENIPKEQLVQYLSENIVGDIEYDGSNLKINNPYSTNTILVKTSKIDKIKNTENIESIVKIAEDIYNIHYSNARDTQSGYNALKQDQVIQNIIKDCKVSLLENDIKDTSLQILDAPKDREAWGINDTGLMLYKSKLNASNNKQEIKVGVLDTGIRITHEVFKNQNTSDRLDLSDSYNFISNNKDVTDDCGHGTMVAGIIAEGTSNNVKIVPVKIMNSNGSGSVLSVLEAINAISSKVDVINLSLGSKDEEISSEARQLFETVIKRVYNSGVLMVCASGNEGEENVSYPANSDYTIAVGAVDIQKQITSFSNFGSTVDFVAPGKGLEMPFMTGDNIYNSDAIHENAKNSGTSFATPFISAAIALIKSENKNATVHQVKNILIDNCEDLGTQGKDKYYGYGLLNFNAKMFNKPVIASVTITDIANSQIKIVVQAIESNIITECAYTHTEAAPATGDWRQCPISGIYVSASLTLSNDRDVYIWFKDEKGGVTSQKVYTSNSTSTQPTNTTPGSETNNSIYGDINQNNSIDLADLLLLKRHKAQNDNEDVAKKHPDWKLSVELVNLGDLNNSGDIDIGDFLKVTRYIVAEININLINKFPNS